MFSCLDLNAEPLSEIMTTEKRISRLTILIQHFQFCLMNLRTVVNLLRKKYFYFRFYKAKQGLYDKSHYSRTT